MTRSNTLRGLPAAVVAVALLVATTATDATAQEKHRRGVPNIVLVHGAWADGSSWSKVIPFLESRGLQLLAVQLPLTSQARSLGFRPGNGCHNRLTGASNACLPRNRSRFPRFSTAR
jgi:pimeloyl-ACP methyl ester carboxylesterase